MSLFLLANHTRNLRSVLKPNNRKSFCVINKTKQETNIKDAKKQLEEKLSYLTIKYERNKTCIVIHPIFAEKYLLLI